MSIRVERDADRAAVLDLHRAAFGDHGDVVVALVDALRDADGAVSLVDDDEGAGVIGHVMLSTALLDTPRRLVTISVLSPLAVVPNRQRSGTGTRLVRAALAAAEGRRVAMVVLEGSPRYYARFGFRPGGSLELRRPSLRIPPEAFQAVSLTTFEPWMTGTVVYPDAFWRVDAVGLREAA